LMKEVFTRRILWHELLAIVEALPFVEPAYSRRGLPESVYSLPAELMGSEGGIGIVTGLAARHWNALTAIS